LISAGVALMIKALLLQKPRALAGFPRSRRPTPWGRTRGSDNELLLTNGESARVLCVRLYKWARGEKNSGCLRQPLKYSSIPPPSRRGRTKTGAAALVGKTVAQRLVSRHAAPMPSGIHTPQSVGIQARRPTGQERVDVGETLSPLCFVPPSQGHSAEALCRSSGVPPSTSGLQSIIASAVLPTVGGPE